MKNKIVNRCSKTLFSSLVAIALLSAADAYATVAQSPLSLTVGVPPNLILTLDDSGSMREAFAPEPVDNSSNSRLGKSAGFNTMYYNPLTTYKIPEKLDNNGNPSESYNTTFTKAYYNGFNEPLGSIDLSTNYKVSWWYKPTAAQSTSFTAKDPDYNNYLQLAKNPEKDFKISKKITIKRSSSVTVTILNRQYQLSRGNNNNCTISPQNSDISCTQSSGDEFIYSADYTAKGVPAYYYKFDTTKCTSKLISDEDCHTLTFVSNTSGPELTDERANFAIWYSFYRNRALATISAARLAFINLSPSVRFTWQSLNECTSLNGTSKGCGGDNMLREFSTAQRGRFFSWMDTLPFFSGTPLRAAMGRAGEFLKKDVAWQNYPNDKGNTPENTYACRPSYHVMMTDGIWNGDNGAPTDTLRSDEKSFKLSDDIVYSGKRAPYSDNAESTLADLAMHYWATDLSPLKNKLTPYIPFKDTDTDKSYWDPRNDPATWQHMVNFTMGLGLTRSLVETGIEWQGSTFASAANGNGFQNIQDGTKIWPAASSGVNNNVYDLWHAAINSRGEFFSVDSPEAMVQAFSDILSRIADRKSTAAKPAINSGQVSEDENDAGVIKTVSYQTSYASDDNWSGDVKRFDKKLNTQTNTFESTEIWSAKSKVPGWQARTIMIAGNGTGSNLVNFSWNKAGVSSTAGTLANLLNKDPENGNAKDTKGEARLEYLRGNRTGEGKAYRQRSTVLGDFYSSSPAVVSGPRYLVNFSNALEGNTAYSTFATSIAARSPRVYVGGNDGMLHGFNAKTGVEEFAFIPSAVFPKLNKLTGTNYSHEYYVEGSPTVADVYDGTAWRTILVGTLKAGGKSVFALDITTPGSEKLLWEFDDSKLTSNTDTVKMGYSFSQPTIARLHSGKWAVVFGNGYESVGNTNGKAALFIVDAVTGALAKTLQVQGTETVSNGLSTPKLGDFNADGVADYAYAGDLQGNMWRFDLMRERSGTSPIAPFKRDDDGVAALDEFKVSYSGKPLFRALATNGTSRQAITSAPSLVRHPTGVGYLVIFGTGKFYETGDKDGDKSMAQTVYGIWDEETLGYTGSTPNISRSNLQVQTVTDTISVTNGTDTRQGRLISSNDIRWKAAGGKPKQNGWYLNLVQADGEMVVENMAQLGRTVFFQSLVPNDDPCGDGTSNWTYAINPFTGGRTPQNAFDYKPSTDIGSTNVSAIRQDGEGGTTISQKSDGKFQLCTGQECANVYPDPLSLGRQSWRRIEETE